MPTFCQQISYETMILEFEGEILSSRFQKQAIDVLFRGEEAKASNRRRHNAATSRNLILQRVKNVGGSALNISEHTHYVTKNLEFEQSYILGGIRFFPSIKGGIQPLKALSIRLTVCQIMSL